ncbi:hypothetical protein MA16_Dca005096 [Dendrobium catenatum]|uniref:Uncharacterized protein n=1 Tax=Dendrobium catenatum TaxID=906689 RepID=A0A2I0VLC6_9ASPA|nr:hypothetical protein MA16_Dca005096 [Dendrobium catenatum]
MLAKSSLSLKESNTGSTTPTTPSRTHSLSTHSLPLMSYPPAGSSLWTHGHSPSFIASPIAPTALTSSVLNAQSPVNRSSRTAAIQGEASSSCSSSRAWNRGTRIFEFPTRRQELVEIQRVTEEMMGAIGSRGGFEGGEMSFRMWWKQEMISPIGARRTS